MEPEPTQESERLFARAMDGLSQGRSQSALADLERALRLNDNHSWYSFLGYCIARERGQVKKGVELCKQSLAREPDVSVHYLNLAKTHLVAGNKPDAIEVLRKGVTVTGSPEILAQLNVMGCRKAPVFSLLSRDHWLNQYLGLLLSRLGLR